MELRRKEHEAWMEESRKKMAETDAMLAPLLAKLKERDTNG